MILLVDDEPGIIELIGLYLKQEGYQFAVAENGEQALEKINSLKPALVVLDIMLPKLNGFEVCKKIRLERNNVPVIMLTAKDDDIDKIIGLEIGADDYLTKPFNPRELIARIKALLRRTIDYDFQETENIENVITFGDMIINIDRRVVSIGNQLIELRSQEFELLCVLAKRPGIVFSREKLLEYAWGYDYFGQTRTVDVHIAQIRKKIAETTDNLKIETITGIGYKLVML